MSRTGLPQRAFYGLAHVDSADGLGPRPTGEGNVELYPEWVRVSQVRQWRPDPLVQWYPAARVIAVDELGPTR